MTSIVHHNIARVYVCMVVLTLIISVLGYFLSSAFHLGLSGTGVFLIIAGIINLAAFYFSDRIVIASARAKPISKEMIPEYTSLVEDICARQQIPIPALYYMDTDAMNAFATGRDPQHAAVVVTRGLLEKLTLTEVRGVVAHELAHIQSFDTRLMAIVAVLAGSISILADMYWRSTAIEKVSEKDRSGIIQIIGLVLAVFAPLTAFFIQLAISRRREYMADARGATMVSDPKSLASALRKIGRDRIPLPTMTRATAHMYFNNPLRTDGIIDRLFATHPPLEERIRLLETVRSPEHSYGVGKQ